jgi:uncharacterized membrane protein YgdD (TMEM256/DUF423 family)
MLPSQSDINQKYNLHCCIHLGSQASSLFATNLHDIYKYIWATDTRYQMVAAVGLLYR